MPPAWGSEGRRNVSGGGTRKKPLFAAAALTLVGTLVATAGCYTSRRVAGDDLVAGPFNPYLWVTIPIDTVLSPYQVPAWLADDTDTWRSWDADAVRKEYHPATFLETSRVR